MLQATLLRALDAVRTKIAAADSKASDWLAERDRRRRQEAAFLRGIVRITGSQRKAALVTGIPQQTISRVLDPEGHAKARADDTARRDPSFEKLGSLDPGDASDEETNVIPIQRRRRKPGWEPHHPTHRELHKWYQQFYCWDAAGRHTAKQIIFEATAKDLPDEAYVSDHDAGSGSQADARPRPVGAKTRPAARGV
jgi:hypothetical protein